MGSMTSLTPPLGCVGYPQRVLPCLFRPVLAGPAVQAVCDCRVDCSSESGAALANLSLGHLNEVPLSVEPSRPSVSHIKVMVNVGTVSPGDHWGDPSLPCNAISAATLLSIRLAKPRTTLRELWQVHNSGCDSRGGLADIRRRL